MKKGEYRIRRALKTPLILLWSIRKQPFTTSREQIELLEMHKDGIMVAEYWTELPSRKELEKKIHSILLEAKERMERKKLIE